MVLNSRLGIRPCLRNHVQVRQAQVRGPFRAFVGQHGRGNPVACVQLRDLGRVGQLVFHGHGGHEPGNGLMIEHHGPCLLVDTLNLPPHEVPGHGDCAVRFLGTHSLYIGSASGDVQSQAGHPAQECLA